MAARWYAPLAHRHKCWPRQRKKNRRCRAMVEIKLDKDKFDERVERIIHNAIGHAFGLKLKNIRPAGTEAIDSPT